MNRISTDYLIPYFPFYNYEKAKKKAEQYKKDYTCKLAKSKAGVYSVTLTPKNRNTMLKSGTLTVSAKDWRPIKLTGVTRSGDKFVLSISSIKAGRKLPDSRFSYNASAFKGYEVIDLR